jgi:hypothetical protein
LPDHIDFVDLGNTALAGLGIGLLVCTAVSLAPALGALPMVGAEVIRIAIRLGVFVADTSQTLEPLDEEGNFDSWAYVVHGVTPEDAQRELDEMYSRKVRYQGGRSVNQRASERRVLRTGRGS